MTRIYGIGDIVVGVLSEPIFLLLPASTAICLVIGDLRQALVAADDDTRLTVTPLIALDQAIPWDAALTTTMALDLTDANGFRPLTAHRADARRAAR